MIRIIFIVTLIFTFSIALHAQDNQQAYKFDEFGSVQDRVWKEKLDKFSELLVSIPDSKLHIIIYAESGKSRTSINDLIYKYRNYLHKTKKVKWANFSFERGGFRNSQTVELWLFPNNAEKPIPTPTEKFKAELYKEYLNLSDSELKNLVQELQELLRNDDGIRSYIFTYGKDSEVISESEKRFRNNIGSCGYGGEGCYFIFVNGGFRETLKVEIWLVPHGATESLPK